LKGVSPLLLSSSSGQWSTEARIPRIHTIWRDLVSHSKQQVDSPNYYYSNSVHISSNSSSHLVRQSHRRRGREAAEETRVTQRAVRRERGKGNEAPPASWSDKWDTRLRKKKALPIVQFQNHEIHEFRMWAWIFQTGWKPCARNNILNSNFFFAPSCYGTNEAQAQIFLEI
jgi:hypothetical protein